MDFLASAFGLYLHVPYCSRVCPYCDFAKTANFDDALAGAYLRRLDSELQRWLEDARVQKLLGETGGFESVFFGGGTPSLFSCEYRDLFARFRPLLRPGAEVSLEANPDDCSAERLAAWRELGVTRLSLGVQTLHDAGLKQLGRAHTSAGARAAIQRALAAFANVNVDLIYGWAGQDLHAWDADLAAVVDLGVPHLSLYTLTFEPRTPLGKRARRGLVAPLGDARVARYYELARQRLAAAGYEQDEVSNWAKPGATCRHNWIYWSDRPYLGIGSGAHGYLPDPAGPGTRYAYGRNDRPFIKGEPAGSAESEADRDEEAWLTEVVGSSLRTSRGVDLAKLERRLGRPLGPSPLLAEGAKRGIISIDPLDGRLRLAPSEWFRENAWAVEVIRNLS